MCGDSHAGKCNADNLESLPMNPAKSFDYRKLFDLSGRVALVIGGGSGIGQAGAEGMAAQGAHVVVADIVPEDAKGVAGRISNAAGKATSVQIDVRGTAAVDAMVAAAEIGR